MLVIKQLINSRGQSSRFEGIFGLILQSAQGVAFESIENHAQ